MFATNADEEYAEFSEILVYYWSSVEITVQKRYYFITYAIPENDRFFIGKAKFIGDTDELFSYIESLPSEAKDLKIGLFIPEWLCNSDFYELKKIRQIWRHSNKVTERFLFWDGTELFYPEKSESALDLVYNVNHP